MLESQRSQRKECAAWRWSHAKLRTEQRWSGAAQAVVAEPTTPWASAETSERIGSRKQQQRREWRRTQGRSRASEKQKQMQPQQCRCESAEAIQRSWSACVHRE